MIDLKTARFILREGVELYPGMTREDFFKWLLYETQLSDESDKENPKRRTYFLKVQNVNGFQMCINIRISLDSSLRVVLYKRMPRLLIHFQKEFYLY